MSGLLADIQHKLSTTISRIPAHYCWKPSVKNPVCHYRLIYVRGHIRAYLSKSLANTTPVTTGKNTCQLSVVNITLVATARKQQIYGMKWNYLPHREKKCLEIYKRNIISMHFTTLRDCAKYLTLRKPCFLISFTLVTPTNAVRLYINTMYTAD